MAQSLPDQRPNGDGPHLHLLEHSVQRRGRRTQHRLLDEAAGSLVLREQ